MKNNSGQTLIEVLAAFGVAVMLATAITIAVISALSNATFSKNQNLATQYAQGGMEMIRKMRNDNFTTFDGLSGNYCLDKRCVGLTDSLPYCWTRGTGCGTNIDNVFVREVAIEKNSPSCANAAKVTVATSWSDSKCTSSPFCHSVQLVSCFSNINAIPAP